ncbi:MAG: pyruvate formate lyase family protein [Christensenellales bacterium]|jgi:pyruvate-formate lyase
MTERIGFLRNDAIERPAPELFSPEMRYLYAKGWQEARHLPNLKMRQTAARAKMLRGMTPAINEWELIVGRQNFDVLLTQEQKAFLEFAEGMMPYRVGQDSHMALDYEKLLALGTDGIRGEIRARKAALDTRENPDDLEKEIFYDNCITVLDALDELAARYASHAKELAASASERRKKELLQIAANLENVPKHPAKTFYEALQAIEIYTFHLGGLYQMGRPDRFLLPYYERDIASGVLTREGALELIDCFCLLYNKTVPKGLAVGLMVGGRDGDGNPVENELTRLFLESILDTRLPYPGVGLCVTRETPDALLRLAVKALGEGLTHPALFNDEVIARGLMDKGLPFAEAVNYIHSTCVEITPIASSGVWVASPYHNLMQPLLDIIAEDKMPDAFDALLREYEKRLSECIFRCAREENLGRISRRIWYTHPLVSCLVNDCLEKGKDIDEGGARYAWVMPSFVGMANLVDSLAAIRKLVYTDKSVSPAEYRAALQSGFEGRGDLLRKIDECPKYGNDDPEADGLAQKISSWIPQEVAKARICYGETLSPSMFCWVQHAEIGKRTGATPDGRPAGFPLGDGSGPAQGRERNGATASILSSTCWDHTPFIGGIAVNMKFGKALFSEETAEKLLSLIRVFMARGGFELQINTVDREVLLDAKAHPERHKDLVVRIGGYSDYFTNLSPAMQEELLLRTEHDS